MGAGDEVILRPGDYELGGNDLQIVDNIDLHGQVGQPPPRILSNAAVAVSTNGVSEALIRDLEIVHTGAFAGLNYAVTVERVEVTSAGAAACAPFFTSTIRDSICRSTAPLTGTGLSFGGGGGAPDYDARAVNVTAIGTAYGIDVDTNNGPDFAVLASNVIAQGGIVDVRAATDAVGGGDADVVLDHSNFQTELEEGDPAA